MRLDLADLAFDRGGALLVRRALRLAQEGEGLTVVGTSADLYVHLRAWCRAEGHSFRHDIDDGCAVIIRGSAVDQRWSAAERAGGVDPLAPSA
jgi:TusA-related sulfurtransferase